MRGLISRLSQTLDGEDGRRRSETNKAQVSKSSPRALYAYLSFSELTVKISRVRTQPDPSKLREFADDVRDGKFVLPIGRRMPLRDAAEAQVLGEKGGIGKILLLAPDSKE